ncbi:MAG: tRNA glutamyl-Q(34) synthetase GluQRS [Pseudomonadota bacterium]
MRHTERFAPSPTGPLHLGHAFSALTAWEAARDAGGRFLLRMEDLDESRSTPGFAAQIESDLHWLGIDWDGPVLLQSSRRAAYDAALKQLSAMGLLYPCTCSRRDIRDAAGAPQEGAPAGLDGVVYPGTCRPAGAVEAPVPPPQGAALRLDLRRALGMLDAPLAFTETGPIHPGEHPVVPERLLQHAGDVVLARRDGAAAYHLAVVVDDAFQEITHVTRGADLFMATPLHRLLQALLRLPVPVWHHHRLIRDGQGRRLAKRDDARSLETMMAEGWTPEDVRVAVGLGRGISFDHDPFDLPD